jgi:hypothetical protein
MPLVVVLQVSFDFLSIVELLVRCCSIYFSMWHMTTNLGSNHDPHSWPEHMLHSSAQTSQAGHYSRRLVRLGLQNIIYCLAQLVEFTAFIYLRIKLPSLPRCASAPCCIGSYLVISLC